MKIEDINFINKALYKASHDRFELRISKNDVPYLYDFDEVGHYRIIKSRVEFNDIMSCMNLLEFTSDENKMKELLERLGEM